MVSNVIRLKDIDSNPFLEIKDLFQLELKEVDNLISSKLSSHVDLIGKNVLSFNENRWKKNKATIGNFFLGDI